VIRIKAGSVRRTGRSTEGVRLMDLPEDDLVCGVASVVETQEGDDVMGDVGDVGDEAGADGPASEEPAPDAPAEPPAG
jgi:hypothetical protein